MHAKCKLLDLYFYLHSFFVCASSEGYGDTARMLIRAVSPELLLVANAINTNIYYDFEPAIALASICIRAISPEKNLQENIHVSNRDNS